MLRPHSGVSGEFDHLHSRRRVGCAVGGDQAGRVNRGNPLEWMSGVIGGIIGAIGPAAMLLMLWSSRRFTRQRAQDPERFRDRLWLMCAAWPSVAFFVLLALRKPVVPS